MFERTFSFWRRLVGKEPHRAQSRGQEQTTAQDERRLWVRYPADLKTSIQLTDDPLPFQAPAKIRDISRGGANLLLDCQIAPGQLVSLEVPSPAEGSQSILACVVRSVREPSGRWALGCVFSRELSEDDLRTLGARRVRHAPEDKRTWMRFPTELHASYQQIGVPDQPAQDAQVLNLSANGIGLLVDEHVDAGALLNVDLIGKNGASVRTILSCVVHVNQRGPAQWALGCNFIRELGEDDLKGLI
jgi:hypothetical protein